MRTPTVSPRSLTITAKVMILIAIPILGTILASLIGIARLGEVAQDVDTLTHQQVETERTVMAWRTMTMASLERTIVLVNSNDAALVATMNERNQAALEQAKEVLKRVEAFARQDPRFKRLYDEVMAKRQFYFDTMNDIVRNKGRWDAAALSEASTTRLLPAIEAYSSAQQGFIDLLKQDIQAAVDASASSFVNGRNLMIAIGVASTLLSLALGWWFSRAVTRPIRHAVDVARAVAEGRIDVPIQHTQHDEIGQLLDAMDRMGGAIRHFTAEQQAMADSHLAGRIDHRMPLDELSGAYRRMGESLNGLAQTHVDVSRQTIETIKAYAAGDYSARMPRLPGELARTSDAMDAVRDTMQKAGAAAAEALRTKRALDVAATPLLMADEQHRVTYVNPSAAQMFEKLAREGVIATASTATLVGASLPALVPQLDTSHLGAAQQLDLELGAHHFVLSINPVVDARGLRGGAVVEWRDRSAELDELAQQKARLEQERTQAAHNARIRSALDTCSTNVMIADVTGHIVYMNETVIAMLRSAEADLRKVMPHFSVDSLIGRSVDDFHKDPAIQRNLLKNLRGKHCAQIRVGERAFQLTASPVITREGQREGTVVEWLDRTAELHAEQQTAELVEAAIGGDFSHRLDMQLDHAFFTQLGQGLNTIMQTIESALNDVSRVLGAVAKGDLTDRITTEYAGTLGQLKGYVNTTVDQLTQIVNEIKDSAGSIHTAAREIAQGNSDLSSRTEEQAASLEQTAASMEELTSTVRQNADNARQANQLASGASDVAQRGGGVVEEVVRTMTDIAESSNRVVDIIAVIDGIAFQTNILALNAAVEAARAGEQGRGFAVVASEVRTLAQRSSEAAREIKELIEDSVGKVQNGTQLVDQAGNTMREIVSAIKRVTDIMGEITIASQEQSSGIEQVNQAITSMDETTQQNAALVEQAAAAADSMAQQSNNLVQTVQVFRAHGADRG